MATKPHDDLLQDAAQPDFPDFSSATTAEKLRLIQLEAIQAYDDFGEVTSLHHWTYDALHAQLTGDMGFAPKYHEHGLSLLFDWLKHRDQAAKTNLSQIVEYLQSLPDPNTVEEPAPPYLVATNAVA